jgi:hypothetical protein
MALSGGIAAIASSRTVGRRTVSSVCDLDFSAQWIPVAQCLNFSQQIAGEAGHHTGEGGGVHHAQPKLDSFIAISEWQRTDSGDAQIRADQAMRFLLQCLPHAV